MSVTVETPVQHDVPSGDRLSMEADTVFRGKPVDTMRKAYGIATGHVVHRDGTVLYEVATEIYDPKRRISVPVFRLTSD